MKTRPPAPQAPQRPGEAQTLAPPASQARLQLQPPQRSSPRSRHRTRARCRCLDALRVATAALSFSVAGPIGLEHARAATDAVATVSPYVEVE